MLLALEPLSEDFPVESLDYDEYSVTSLVCSTLKNLTMNGIELVVRLHPRQSRSIFHHFLKSEKLDDCVVLCPDIVTEVEFLVIADIVIGMYSVFLMKAMVLGKPTLSLQFFSRSDVVNKWEMIPPLEKVKIRYPSDLGTSIVSGLSGRSEVNKFLPLGSVGRVWHEMQMLF